ncbi:MAG: type II toxin-antitoxin system PemK/MazF family toxin [Deltaproteobacteria bacterium]|nr:type II toxin-antitoxin system PemK/MazF family toxin [Deltaproteobacteria bacterium]
MMRCEPGDIILVRFPFTDLATSKRRPGLVVSPAEFADRHGDIVLLALTSQDQDDEELRLEHWQTAGLPKPTWVKPLVGTLASSLVERRLGTLDRADEGRVRAAIERLVAPCFRRA